MGGASRRVLETRIIRKLLVILLALVCYDLHAVRLKRRTRVGSRDSNKMMPIWRHGRTRHRRKPKSAPLYITLQLPPEGVNEHAVGEYQYSLQSTSSYPCDLRTLRTYLRDKNASLPGEIATFEKEWAYMMKEGLPYLNSVTSIESPLDPSALHDKKAAQHGFIKRFGNAISVQGVKLLEIENVKDLLDSWPLLSSLQSDLLQMTVWKAKAHKHFIEKGFKRGWTEDEASWKMLTSLGSALLASLSIGSELGAFSGVYADIGIAGESGNGFASSVAGQAAALDAQMSSVTDWVAAGIKDYDGLISAGQPVTPEGLINILTWLQDHPPPEVPEDIMKHIIETYNNTNMVVADGIGVYQDTMTWAEYADDLQAHTGRICSSLPIIGFQLKSKTVGVYAPLRTFTDVQQGHLYSVYTKMRDLFEAMMLESNTNPIIRHHTGPEIVPLFRKLSDSEPVTTLPRGTMLMRADRRVPARSGRSFVRWRVDDSSGLPKFQEAWIPSQYADQAPVYYALKKNLIIYSLVGDVCAPTSTVIEVGEDFYVRSRRSLACHGCNKIDAMAKCYCMELAGNGGWVCPQKQEDPGEDHGLAVRRVARYKSGSAVPYQLDDDDAGSTLGTMHNANQENSALYAARMGNFAIGLTAAIGGLLVAGPVGAGLGVMGMVSAGIAGTDSVASGVLNLNAQTNIDVRLEAFLFALSKWEYFLAKSPPSCDITERQICQPGWVCLRDMVFFNTDGDERADAALGWCVPSLQPLQDVGMPCALSKDCLSGYCHYVSGGSMAFESHSKKLARVTKKSGVTKQDLQAVVASTGICKKACKLAQLEPPCASIGLPSFGVVSDLT